MNQPLSESSRGELRDTSQPVAVIDIGASSIRMAVAEIHPTGEIRMLDRLSQAVRLGKDTFTSGNIKARTIEDCVRVLKSHRRVLNEYQIVQSSQVRVVATSAVREAVNRLQFIDRIYMATGFRVKLIDEADISRVTYLGLQPVLRADPRLNCAATVIAEVGGGNTDVLAMQEGNVLHSHTYRLGSLRLREMLESSRTPRKRVRKLMETQIDRVVEAVSQQLVNHKKFELIALGGDIRFAAAQLIESWNPNELADLEIKRLEDFTDAMLNLTEDELISRHKLTFADAETLGPALLTYVRMAREFGLKSLKVSDFNLRDAILNEMSIKGVLTQEFTDQVLQSAIALGHKYCFDESHGLRVAGLCSTIFDALRPEHGLDETDELLLRTAAILHEIGSFVSNRGHHKHSMYLISNSEVFGLSPRQMKVVALVARYHRRASPKPTHDIYMSLDQPDRIRVAQMAAILRAADSLDGSRSQRVDNIECSYSGSKFIITVPGTDDLSLEQLVLRQKGAFFEDTFGMRVQIRSRPI